MAEKQSKSTEEKSLKEFTVTQQISITAEDAHEAAKILLDGGGSVVSFAVNPRPTPQQIQAQQEAARARAQAQGVAGAARPAPMTVPTRQLPEKKRP